MTHPAEQLADEKLALEHGMTTEEYANVCEILDRAPTITELGMFSVMWSEHCSYKSSKVHLQTLPTEGAQVLEGPGENAGAVDLGDGWAGVFKVESHNHPSYIEPYQGAATGVGGILRDIFTMGARPLALLNSLRFGPLEKPKNRYLLDGVVGGIAGYGNCMGVPTVGGEIYFDPAYDQNPLVNVMCFGVAPADRIIKARASGANNPVIYVGAKTGRDGIYGVSLLASSTFDEAASEKRPAVQVGDPFTEKLLLESCLELIERDLVVGMQDMGGAGLTCSTCEMGSKAGTGLEIDVRLVPSRETGMTPYEFMLSESQERMLLVCRREDLTAVQETFEKWDLHAIEIGKVTDDGMLRVFDGEKLVAEVPARSLADDGPTYERPTREAAALAPLTEDDLPGPAEAVATRGGVSSAAGAESTSEGEACREILLELLADPNIASKRWVFQQYDQTVRTNTVQRPGGDAAVIRAKETGGAVALSLDGNPWYTTMDARVGAALAVAEACRNVACTGARPIGITNCLNFGSPEVEETMARFAGAVRGMGEACRALGVPVTGGNVSFYNETEDRPILPTPVVGALGHMGDGHASVPSGFQRHGDAILLLGADADVGPGKPGGVVDWGLGGSALVRCLHDGKPGAPPGLDLEREAALQKLLVDAAGCGWLRSAHDCSDGGLGVALAEACFMERDAKRADAVQGTEAASGNPRGATIELGDGRAGRPDLRLYGESASRAIVSVAPEHVDDLEAMAGQYGVPASRLGTVRATDGSEGARRSRGSGDRSGEPAGPELAEAVLEFSIGGEPFFGVSVTELYEAWATSLARNMEAGAWHAV